MTTVEFEPEWTDWPRRTRIYKDKNKKKLQSNLANLTKYRPFD